MTTAFNHQYQLARQTRTIVFDHLSTRVKNDIHTPVPAFDNNTISRLLVHSAYCYYNWLACYAMGKPPLKDISHNNLQEIQNFYFLIDDTVGTFLRQFNEKMEQPITGTHDALGQVDSTPIQVFTHVLTHEFHHKGQMMSMCRILGYPPPDTDMSNFFGA